MKRIITIILCFALCFVMVGGSILPGFSFVAKAASEDVSFDDRYIESDLADLGVDISSPEYQQNPNADAVIVQVFEYCYSEDRSKDEKFGLYLYVYNPTLNPIDVESSLNVVNMAIAYDDEGEPSEYSNERIEFVDVTNDHRFYKFKINSPEKVLARSRKYAYLHSNERRYDIASLQLNYSGDVKRKDFGVNTCYRFTGYAKGLSDESYSSSTLRCNFNGVDSINLKLYHTAWRDPTYHNNYTTQVTSVYFGVPKKYFEQYEDLVEIKCEFYKALTKDIFVTASKQRYDELLKLIGKDVGLGTDEVTARVLWEIDVLNVLLGPNEIYYNKGYNAYKKIVKDGNISYEEMFPSLLDPGNNLLDIHQFSANFIYRSIMNYLLYIDKPIESLEDYFVSSGILQEYMKWYSQNIASEISEFGYSKDLFYDDTISKFSGTIGDGVGSITVANKQSFWESLVNDYSYSSMEFELIEVLDFDTINEMSVDQFENTYFVDDDNVGPESETGSVRQDCIDMFDRGLVPVIFHFAANDYYSSKAIFDNTDYYYTGEGSAEISAVNGYVARQWVFLNFDIISLSFLEENGNKVVIPVVANPINIIAGLTAPTDIIDEPWWKFIVILLTIIIIILAVMFLGGPLSVVFNLILSGVKFILKILLWIIKLPFKLVGALRRR